MDGESVRRMRVERGWSQSELAEKIFASKRTIINWEGGQKIPKGKVALLERAFSTEQASDVNEEISPYSKEFDVDGAHEVSFLKNTNGNIFESLPNDLWRLTVDLIPAKAYARYVSEQDDVAMAEPFDQVSFIVDRYARGNYKAFEIKGDSMDDGSRSSTPEKAIVLARELLRDRWPKGFRDAEFGWIIVTRDNILFKDISDQDLKNGIITCHSRNPSPEYNDFPLSLDEDVKQIFKVIKRQL